MDAMLEEDYSLGLEASHLHLGGYSEALQWEMTHLGANQELLLLQHTERPHQGGSSRPKWSFRLEDPQSRNNSRDRDELQEEGEDVGPNRLIHQMNFKESIRGK